MAHAATIPPMDRRADFSLFLVVEGLCARVDIHTADGRRSHGRVEHAGSMGPAGLGDAIGQLLAGGPAPGRRAGLLFDGCWSGLVRAPASDELGRALAIAAQGRSHVAPSNALTGWSALEGSADPAELWTTIAPRHVAVDAAQRLAAERSDLAWIAHPAGLLRGCSGLRTEVWPGLTWCGGGGAPLRILEGAPGSIAWAGELRGWLAERRGSAPILFAGPADREALGSARVAGRRALLPERRQVELLHAVAARWAETRPAHAAVPDAPWTLRANEVGTQPEAPTCAAETIASAAVVRSALHAAPSNVALPSKMAVLELEVAPARRHAASPTPYPALDIPAAIREPRPSRTGHAGTVDSARLDTAVRIERPNQRSAVSRRATTTVLAPRRAQTVAAAKSAPPSPLPPEPSMRFDPPAWLPAALTLAIALAIGWHQHTRAPASEAQGGVSVYAVDGSDGASATDVSTASILELCRENLVQRRRLPALIDAIVRHTQDDLQLRRVVAKLGGVATVEGLGASSAAVDRFCAAVAGELARYGWVASVAVVQRRALPSGGRAWEFALELTPHDPPVEFAPSPGSADLPAPADRSELTARTSACFEAGGAEITASRRDDGTLSRSSQEVVALAEGLVGNRDKPMGWRYDLRTPLAGLAECLRELAAQPEFVLPAAIELESLGADAGFDVRLWLWL